MVTNNDAAGVRRQRIGAGVANTFPLNARYPWGHGLLLTDPMRGWDLAAVSRAGTAAQFNRLFLGVLFTATETGLGQETAKPQSMRRDRRARLAAGAGDGGGREMTAIHSPSDATPVTCIVLGRLHIFA